MDSFLQHYDSGGSPEIENLLHASNAAAIDNLSLVIGSEHLLLSILQNSDRNRVEFLRNLGLTSEAVTEHIELLFSRISKPLGAMKNASSTKNSSVLAPIFCRILDDVKEAAPKSVNLETVSLYALQAILKYEDCVAFKIIQNIGIDVAALREWVTLEIDILFAG